METAPAGLSEARARQGFNFRTCHIIYNPPTPPPLGPSACGPGGAPLPIDPRKVHLPVASVLQRTHLLPQLPQLHLQPLYAVLYVGSLPIGSLRIGCNVLG